VKNLIFNNLSLKVSAILLSVLLWFFVASRGQSEIALEAPLEFRGIPEELGIISSNVKTVMLTVRGQERFMKTLNASNIRVFIDLSKAREGEGIYHVNKEDVRLPFAISVTNVEPASIKVKLEERVSRSVPVRVSIIGTPEKGAAVSASVEPETVVIRGLKSEIKQIRYLVTEDFDITDIKGTVTKSLELDTSGMNIIPEISKVTVKFTYRENKT
jgi:YbbR domain-containing protein